MKLTNLIAILILSLSVKLMASEDKKLSDQEEKPYITSKEIFNPLEDGMGYHNYRIPSLLLTEKGTLLALMEGREGMNFDHAKNDLVLKRSVDGGESWSKPTVIAEDGDNVVMNGVLTEAVDGTIILTYIHFPINRHSDDRAHGITQVDSGLKGEAIQRVFFITSSDEGVSWSEPTDITGITKSGKNSVTTISGPGVGVTITEGEFKGRIIVPMSENIQKRDEKLKSNFALYSDDNGKSWKRGKAMPASDIGESGGNEVQMVELNEGVIYASIRSKGSRLITRSSDGGKSWDKLQREPSLVDTGCMSPMLRHIDSSGVVTLLHISITDRIDGRRRGKAVVNISKDNGKTWSQAKILYNKEFDYSSLVQMPDGSIAMLAEYNFNGDRANIMFTRFNMAWLKE